MFQKKYFLRKSRAHQKKTTWSSVLDWYDGHDVWLDYLDAFLSDWKNQTVEPSDFAQYVCLSTQNQYVGCRQVCRLITCGYQFFLERIKQAIFSVEAEPYHQEDVESRPLSLYHRALFTMMKTP